MPTRRVSRAGGQRRDDARRARPLHARQAGGAAEAGPLARTGRGAKACPERDIPMSPKGHRNVPFAPCGADPDVLVSSSFGDLIRWRLSSVVIVQNEVG